MIIIKDFHFPATSIEKDHGDDHDTSFYAIPGDEPGDISYMISGDADLGAGIVPISAMFVLHVKGLMASHFDAVIDTPVLK